MPTNKPITPPAPGQNAIQWAAANPQAFRSAIEALNMLIGMQVEIANANSTRNSQNAIITSSDRYLLPIPVKLDTPISNANGTAASASDQLNLLLAALRRTGQLPS